MSKLLNIFEFTTTQIRAIATEQSVADAPIVLGDVTIIPVSKLSCGFSCGGSDLAQKKKADGLMGGAGAKVTKTPLSFLNYNDAGTGTEVVICGVISRETAVTKCDTFFCNNIVIVVIVSDESTHHAS